MPRVLVAYATKHGSTREVAEAIAARLRENGLDADLRCAADVEAVDDYASVVVGGSIYMGRWHGDARALQCLPASDARDWETIMRWADEVARR
jgi:menaquinone-dependent protoporphyrinogen oxidase